MPMIVTLYDLISCLLVIVLGLIFCINLNRYFSISQSRIFLLYLWHTFFSFVYFYYALNVGADATGYYDRAGVELRSFEFGTIAVDWLVAFFRIFDLSLLGTFLCFNILGTIGLIAFYASLNKAAKYGSVTIRRFILFLVLLPSISFWSSAIGKDAISFMAINLMLWAMLNFQRHKKLILLSIGLMLFVRPHMAGIMLLALAGSLFFQRNVNVLLRAFMILIAISASVILVPFALKYAGLGGDVDISKVQNFIENRQGHNQDGGGGIDIGSMSLPAKLFTYLFRPMPIEVSSIPQLAASIDNIILLFFTLFGIFSLVRGRDVYAGENHLFMWFYVMSTWIILAVTTANLGIAVRQKWMFLTVLIYLFVSALAAKKSNRYKQY